MVGLSASQKRQALVGEERELDDCSRQELVISIVSDSEIKLLEDLADDISVLCSERDVVDIGEVNHVTVTLKTSSKDIELGLKSITTKETT